MAKEDIEQGDPEQGEAFRRSHQEYGGNEHFHTQLDELP